MTRNLSILFISSLLTLFASCAKVGPTGPTGKTGPTGSTGPAGPSFIGSIGGHVFLYDQYGSRVLTGLDSVTVVLNSLYSGHPNSGGYYRFDSVSTGMFTLGALVNGYGTTFLNKFAFVQDTLNKDIKLSAIPTFTFTSFHAFHDSVAAGDSLIAAYLPVSRVRSAVLFVGSNAQVSNNTANYLLAYEKNLPVNSTSLKAFIPAQDLTNAGFASGSKVYYAIYPHAFTDYSVYEDISTGKSVYNAIGTPLIDSVIVP